MLQGRGRFWTDPWVSNQQSPDWVTTSQMSWVLPQSFVSKEGDRKEPVDEKELKRCTMKRRTVHLCDIHSKNPQCQPNQKQIANWGTFHKNLWWVHPQTAKVMKTKERLRNYQGPRSLKRHDDYMQLGFVVCVFFVCVISKKFTSKSNIHSQC